MTELLALCAALRTHFSDWHPSRLICLGQIVLGIMMVKTINLVQVATAFRGKAKQASNYKRINRFMAKFEFSFDSVAKFVVSIFHFGTNWTLAIDWTNWKFGKKDINIFVLSICHNGIAIPLLWKTLNKRANTKTSDCIEMLERFSKIFGFSKISNLLADREFVGKEWFQYLISSKIPFIIRIKCSFNISNGRGRQKPARNFFRNLKPGSTCSLGKRVVLGCSVFVVGEKLLDGTYRIVVTDNNPKHALVGYEVRQEIETMFGCLKIKGFNFESTHMTEPARIDKLLAVMTIAFAWSYRTGEVFSEVEPIATKSHGDKAKSYFRHGYDYLRKLVINFCDRSNEFFKSLEVIKSGKQSHNLLKTLMKA